jgi:hypothetical protein
MEDVYLCPRCGEPMRLQQMVRWLRLVEPWDANVSDEQLHFFCAGCALPLTYPRHAPLAVA